MAVQEWQAVPLHADLIMVEVLVVDTRDGDETVCYTSPVLALMQEGTTDSIDYLIMGEYGVPVLFGDFAKATGNRVAIMERARFLERAGQIKENMRLELSEDGPGARGKYSR